MNATRCNGFTLGELVVGLVFLAVVLGPFLLFVSRIQELNSAIGSQARRESWRSFNDQVVAAGIDPGQAPGLAAAKNPAIPALAISPARQVPTPASPGLPLVVPLQTVPDRSIAEPRLVGAGYQLGAGGAVAPLTTPTAPLPPVVMPLPTVTPPDGTVVELPSLAPGEMGDPSTMAVRIASTSGNQVRARINASATAIQSLSTIQTSVTAAELLNGVTGTAWTEYSGSVADGDRAVQFEDGRTRWLVHTSDGRIQIYDPSAFLPFGYRLNLGAPVLVRGTEDVPSGTAVVLDFGSYSRIQTGTTALRIDFPQATRNAFGRTWDARAFGFNWTFNGAAGPFSGSFTPFFLPDSLPLWADSVAVTASAVLPASATARSGAWTLVRMKTALGAPVMATSADPAGFYSPGGIEFSVPLTAGGTALGRLSFDNGAYLSTGPNLSITVIP